MWWTCAAAWAVSPAADQAVIVPGGSGPMVIAAGDFDGDGDADVLANWTAGGGVAWGVFRGGPAGLDPNPVTFAAPRADVVVLDVNGDGIDDWAMSDLTGGRVTLYFGGAGVPAVPGPVLTVNHPLAPVGGDVDADGHDDLALVTTDELTRTEAVHLYRGTPTGFDGAPALAMPGTVVAVALTDVDADGFDDLVHGWRSELLVHRGGPAGPSAVATWTSSWLGPNVADLIVGGDLDGDGHDDVLAEVEDLYFTFYLPFRGSPTGLVPVPAGPVNQISRYRSMAGAFVPDEDGDGDDELILGTPYRRSDRGALTTLAGGAAPAVVGTTNGTLRQGTLGRAVAAGDVNADGIADRLTLEGDTILVFLGP